MSQQYAILRHAKIKSYSKLRSASLHNQRKVDVPNADESRPILRVHGQDEMLDTLVKQRIETLHCKTRKDSVLAMELILTASPDYFRPKNPLKWGKYDQKKLDAWQAKTLDHLKERFGENLIAVDLHLDEATPHFHAVITPIERKMRKRKGKDEYYEANVLSAKTMFGRDQLRANQTAYAAAVSSLGLTRGTENSKARHTTLKQYYSRLNHKWKLVKDFYQNEASNAIRRAKNGIRETIAGLIKANKELEEKLSNANSRAQSNWNEAVEARLEKNKADETISDLQQENTKLKDFIRSKNRTLSNDHSLGL
jgi:hypothetical protein